MKVHVKQYRPAFYIEGFTEEEADIERASELLALPFIERWTRSPGFSRFSISHNYPDYPLYHNLMAEFEDGKYWVVANIHGQPEAEFFKYFPKWVPK